jgi:hypothetical protein
MPLNIAQTIYDNWRELRAAGRFDDLLPSARAWKSVTDDGHVEGYDTCEYQVNRDISIPGSGPGGGNGVAGLVETYFSIRHHNGWGHNLHVHVVEAKNEELQVSHLAQLFRNMAGVRVGLFESGARASRPKEWRHRDLYVHGLLLGPVASGDVLMAEAMLDRLYDPLHVGVTHPVVRVGCVSAHKTKGIRIKRIQPDVNYASESYYSVDGKRPLVELQETIENLLGSSPMWAEWVEARNAEERAHIHDVDKIRDSALTEGVLKGKRDTLLRLLAQAEIALTEDSLADIEACADTASLDRWIDNVSGAKIAADVLC